MKIKQILDFLKNNCIGIPYDLFYKIENAGFEMVNLGWSHTEYFLKIGSKNYDITKYVDKNSLL